MACRSSASRASSRPMPEPSSRTRIRSPPPPSISMSIREAPASSAFSMSSLTAEAGRSTTSPAAMRSITVLSRRWMRGKRPSSYRAGSGGSQPAALRRTSAPARRKPRPRRAGPGLASGHADHARTRTRALGGAGPSVIRRARPRRHALGAFLPGRAPDPRRGGRRSRRSGRPSRGAPLHGRADGPAVPALPERRSRAPVRRVGPRSHGGGGPRPRPPLRRVPGRKARLELLLVDARVRAGQRRLGAHHDEEVGRPDAGPVGRCDARVAATPAPVAPGRSAQPGADASLGGFGHLRGPPAGRRRLHGRGRTAARPLLRPRDPPPDEVRVPLHAQHDRRHDRRVPVPRLPEAGRDPRPVAVRPVQRGHAGDGREVHEDRARPRTRGLPLLRAADLREARRIRRPTRSHRARKGRPLPPRPARRLQRALRRARGFHPRRRGVRGEHLQRHLRAGRGAGEENDPRQTDPLPRPHPPPRRPQRRRQGLHGRGRRDRDHARQREVRRASRRGAPPDGRPTPSPETRSRPSSNRSSTASASSPTPPGQSSFTTSDLCPTAER